MKNEKGKLWKRKWKILEAQWRRLPEVNEKRCRVQGNRTKNQRQEAGSQKLHERLHYDETVVKACPLRFIKDPYEQKSQETIRNRVESYAMSIMKAFSGLMKLVT